MELSMNIIGNIGADAVLKDVNGKTVLNFNVAHSEKWKDAQGTEHERTTWVSCALFDQPKIAPYLKKGTMVFITGTPQAQGYQAKDGTIKADLKCNVMRLRLLSAAPAASTGTNNGAATTTQPATNGAPGK